MSDKKSDYNPRDQENVYTGPCKNKSNQNSWLIAGSYDLDALTFTPPDGNYADYSILMKSEYVQACTEFAPNRIVVFADLS